MLEGRKPLQGDVDSLNRISEANRMSIRTGSCSRVPRNSCDAPGWGWSCWNAAQQERLTGAELEPMCAQMDKNSSVFLACIMDFCMISLWKPSISEGTE